MKAKTYLSRREFLKTALMASGGVALAACAKTPTAAPTAAPTVAAATSKRPLRAAIFSSTIADGWKNVAKLFEEKYPGETVEFIPIQGTDWEEFFGKIATQIAAGNAPDIVQVATEGTQLFAGKKLGISLDDYVKKDKDVLAEYFKDVSPALVESMLYEGQIYQLPMEWNAPNMFFRKDMFEAAGISYPAADWDKDTFYNIAKQLTKKTADGKPDVFGFGWTNRLWGSWTPWMFVNDSNLLEESRAPGGEWFWEMFYKDDPAAKGRSGGWRYPAPKANAPANVEALEFVMQMTKEGTAPSVELGKGESLEGFFASGKLAMTLAGGFWVDGLNSSGLDKTKFDVQFFPRWKSQRHQFGAAGFFITSASDRKDLAWEFCKLSVSKEGIGAYYIKNYTTPARRSMMTAERYGETGPEHWQVFYDTLDKYTDTAPIPAPPQSNEMTTILTKYTGLAMSFEMTAKEALDAMQKELEALFAKPL